MPDPLRTERLLLRPWARDDLDALFRIWSDPQTIWWGPHTRVEQTAALLEKILLETGWWAVGHEGAVVGNVFLRPSRHGLGALELGYHFRSETWGKGLATEAARALLELAPGRRVLAPVVPDNERSKKVVRKLGFRVIGEVTIAERVHELWERGPEPVSALPPGE